MKNIIIKTFIMLIIVLSFLIYSNSGYRITAEHCHNQIMVHAGGRG